MPPKKSKAGNRKKSKGNIEPPPASATPLNDGEEENQVQVQAQVLVTAEVHQDEDPKSPTPPPNDSPVPTGQDGIQEQDDGLSSISRPKPKKRRVVWKEKNQPTRLSAEQEADLKDWLQDPDQLFLYNKSHEKYLDKQKKDRAWQDKAQELGMTADRLTSWFKNIRDTYTKAKREMEGKSGSGAVHLKGRKKWVFDNFAFLADYLYPNPNRRKPGLYASKLGVLPSGTLPDSVQEDHQEDYQDEEDSQQNGDTQSPPDSDSDDNSHMRAVSQNASVAKNSGTKRVGRKTSRDSRDTRQALHDLIETNTKQAETLGQAISSAVGQVKTIPEGFGLFLSTVPPTLDASLLPQFYQDCLDLVLRYQRHSDTLRSAAARSQSAQRSPASTAVHPEASRSHTPRPPIYPHASTPRNSTSSRQTNIITARDYNPFAQFQTTYDDPIPPYILNEGAQSLYSQRQGVQGPSPSGYRTQQSLQQGVPCTRAEASDSPALFGDMAIPPANDATSLTSLATQLNTPLFVPSNPSTQPVPPTTTQDQSSVSSVVRAATDSVI